jgi:hypothetical protein
MDDIVSAPGVERRPGGGLLVLRESPVFLAVLAAARLECMTAEEHLCQFGTEYRGTEGECCFMALHLGDDLPGGGREENWFPLWWTPQRGTEALRGLGISESADPEWWGAPELADALRVPEVLQLSQTTGLVRWEISATGARVELARGFGEPYEGLLGELRRGEDGEILPRHEMAGPELKALVRRGFLVAAGRIDFGGDVVVEFDPGYSRGSEYSITPQEMVHFIRMVQAVDPEGLKSSGYAGLLRLALENPPLWKPGTTVPWWEGWVKILNDDLLPLPTQEGSFPGEEWAPDEVMEEKDLPLGLSLQKANYSGWSGNRDLAAVAAYKSRNRIWNPGTGLTSRVHYLPVLGRARYQEEILRAPKRGEQLPIPEEDLPSEVRTMIRWLREADDADE